jgi:hypothetical protein
MRIGDLSDVTPCSTEVFECECGYKMVRMLFRVLRYLPLAIKARNLSAKELLFYRTELARGEEAWGKNLPIIQTFLDKINANTEPDQKFRQTKPKEKLPKTTSSMLCIKALTKMLNIILSYSGKTLSIAYSLGRVLNAKNALSHMRNFFIRNTA